MRNIFRSNFKFNFNPFGENSVLNAFKQLKRICVSGAKSKSQAAYMTIGLGMLCSFYFLNNKVECVEREQTKSTQSTQQGEVQIYQLNKYQFLELLTNVNEQILLVVFKKYFRNEQEKQFAQKLQKLYIQAKQLKVNKIYLIENNDIKHLETFKKWLSNQKNESKQDSETTQQNESKIEYFFLAPYFKNNPFKLEEEQIDQQVQEIRQYQIRFNPKTNEEIFTNYRTQVNSTTVVKQCPEYVLPLIENECIKNYRTQIATLIEQKMLKNKSQEFAFYALTPNSKKDNSQILSFQNTLKQQKNQQRPLPNGQTPELQDQKKSDNMYVFRNDILGKEIDNMKSFKKVNYSALKSLSSYEKFLLFIRPRIFIVSKANSSIDLYWYVTCLHKNRQPTISINNTDSFNLGRKYPLSDGLSYPQNVDLQFLKLLYKNHPYLNFLIVNTEIVSELIRHLPVKRKQSIFSLTSDMIYPKMFLPHYDNSLSLQQNYDTKFASLIHKYLTEPKNYDSVVLDKQRKLNRKDLEEHMKRPNQQFVLRVCNLNCQQDISDKKLTLAFAKMNSQKLQESAKQTQTVTEEKQQKHRQNQVYRSTYWIDSYFNNVGMKDGDYLFSEGKFSQL